MPKKFREFFKLRPKEQKRKLPLSYWIVVFILGLLLLNFALLLPQQISALWFELELLVIQFLRNPIVLQTWEFIVLFFIVAWIGKFVMPVIDIPATKESHFYIWRREEGGITFFRMLNGKELAFDAGGLDRKLLRWQVFWPVNRIPQGNVILYETAELEVSSALMWMRYAEATTNELATLYAEKERRETTLTFDQHLADISARSRGDEE